MECHARRLALPAQSSRTWNGTAGRASLRTAGAQKICRLGAEKICRIIATNAKTTAALLRERDLFLKATTLDSDTICREQGSAMAKHPDPIKVLIVDDHPVVRIGLRTMLESESNISVSGVAESARDAMLQVEKLAPDVVLMDLRMPEMEGTEAITALRRSHPDLPILVLTNYGTDEYIFRALQAGAMGYLLKSAPQAEIVHAVETVQSKRRYIPAGIRERLSEMIGREELSQRELEVLTLVAMGKSNKEIAKSLFISDKTARNHVASCLLKLGAHDRTEAATTAIKRGLIRLPE